MRLVSISDTHTKHSLIHLPDGNILVHAGDSTYGGRPNELEDFGNWLEKQTHRFDHIIIISGNHDWMFQNDLNRALSYLPKSVIYLEDSGISLDKVSFWGTPWQPIFFQWAFNATEKELANKFSSIPNNVNVLISHGPPDRILDKTTRGDRAGSESLRKAIEKTNPTHCIVGHIHEGFGSVIHNSTRFYNVSVCNERYEVVNPPTIIEV